ncbi:hypothetical protein GE09DRAFT_1231925 [Coniochaeta sp. 2T2.1]|nr:hypothetical protein GE09DRAFT_1231925 [Coniochaeta sp. 2T2.1]
MADQVSLADEDLAHFAGLVDPGADEDADPTPSGEQCPSKSSGSDSATTALLQLSRGSVTADRPSPNDDKLSSPLGDMDGILTVPGSEGNSKPSPLEPLDVDRLDPTPDGAEASQPIPEAQNSPPASTTACGLPTPTVVRLGTSSMSGDPDQSTCHLTSAEAAATQPPRKRKRARNSDAGPATPAKEPSGAASANKKRKGSWEEPIDLTGEDDDPKLADE